MSFLTSLPSRAFADLSRTVGFAKADTAPTVSTPPADSSPAKTTAGDATSGSPSVLRGVRQTLSSMLDWFNPGAKNGIIIVGGKGGGGNTNPAGDRGIIIVGGKAPTQPANPVAERGIIIVGGKDKDREAQDKLGNFEIQGLMSDFNEAQTLASSVAKKKDDSARAVIGKI